MAKTEPLRIVDLAVGTHIRDWRVEQHLADGGSASVYRATYVGISDKFPSSAVLRISGDLGLARTQATIAAYNQAPNSPHVITVFDLFEWANGSATHLVFVLESAEHTLADQLLGGTQSNAEAHRMVKDVGTGLAAYHRADLVHGDVKPSNIMWADGVWKLGDHAGAAPVDVDGDSTAATLHEASSGYRPPESLDEPDRAHRHGDIWALAVVAHEAVAGRAPFSSRRQQMVGPYEIGSELDDEMREFIAGALRFDPSERLARTAADLKFVDEGVFGRISRKLKMVWLTVLLFSLLMVVMWVVKPFADDAEVGVPVPISPVTVTADPNPTFRWQGVEEANSYLLFVNQQGDSPEMALISRRVSAVDAACAGGAECRFAPDVGITGAFEWWITAFFDDGSSAESEGMFVVIELAEE